MVVEAYKVVMALPGCIPLHRPPVEQYRLRIGWDKGYQCIFALNGTDIFCDGENIIPGIVITVGFQKDVQRTVHIDHFNSGIDQY